MFKKLFDPKKIGSLEIKNRFVMPAMDSHLTNSEHEFTQQAYNYYGERALGGFGLLITEYICVSEEGLSHSTQAGIYDDRFIPSLAGLAERVHECGGAIFAQLQHCGRRQGRGCTDLAAVGAGPIPAEGGVYPVHELTLGEVRGMIEKFADAAERAQKAGFDGVEIHAAHGYLLDQFLSRATNKRSDCYGGTLSGRARIVCEIIKAVKERCGRGYPVSVRLNASEAVNDGNAPEDAAAFGALFEAAGADMLNVSCSPAIRPYQFRPGFNLEHTKRVRNAVSIPVVAVGRINDPSIALAAIESGCADFVALGRQSICDSHFPEKVKDGRLDEILTCTGCMQRCLYSESFEEGYGVSCMINPFSGKERLWEIKPAEKPKRIGVVGAGPAGLQAAWILAKRGHRVELLERESHAGGQYHLAAVPPMKQTLGKTIATYTALCEKYGVKMCFGVDVSEALLAEKDYDEVVIAIGSVPMLPRIPGIDDSEAALASDVLSYHVAPQKGRCAVLGAGLVGVETAEILAECGNEVTVIDMLSEPAPLAPPAPRQKLLARLAEKGVRFMLNSRVNQIFNDGIGVEQHGVRQELRGFDTVVLAFGARPDARFVALKQDESNKYHFIGDASQAGDAKKAIFEATELAMIL